jgi:hypothetical protein
MGYRTKRRMRQLALVTVAAPVAAWALDQAARRAEARDRTSPASRRLRQGADFVQRFGRGPLADRSGRRPGHHLGVGGGRNVGSGSSAAVCPFP